MKFLLASVPVFALLGAAKADCLDGYTYVVGDIDGCGTINGRGNCETVETCDTCGQLCNENESCQSYECGDTSKVCSLNGSTAMTTTEQWQDSEFCARSCREGYVSVSGDISGWGEINGKGGAQLVNSCEECARLCDSEQTCMSYECSFTTLYCNLNTAHEPENAKHEDYEFCKLENDQCRVEDANRVNCGFGGITRRECEDKGCCYNDTNVLTAWCFYPNTAEPTAEPTTAEPTAEPTTAEPTAAPTDAAQGGAHSVECSGAPELIFDAVWSNVNGRRHLDLDQDGVITFSLKGGPSSGVNILLANAAELSGVTDLTESYTNAYDLYIGSTNENIIHGSASPGGAPAPGAVVDIGSRNQLITSTEYTKVWIKVAGTVVSVGKGDDASVNTVFSYDFGGSDYNIDRAVFTYGYGDLECSCPNTKVYDSGVNLYNKKTYPQEEFTITSMAVDMRTLEATFVNPLGTGQSVVNSACAGTNVDDGAVLTIDISGTPFQLAGLPDIALNGSSWSEVQSGGYGEVGEGREYGRNGALFNWGWGSSTVVTCETRQKCTVRNTGSCGNGGFINFREIPVHFKEDFLHNSNQGEIVQLEFIPGHDEGTCAQEQGKCDVSPSDLGECGAGTRDQCATKSCCWSETAENESVGNCFYEG